jgi:putative membrane protein
MLWIKSFHIIAVVCWFAVLFYLPRLFVYHSLSEDKTSQERFVIMERKLLRGIGTPSMIVAIVLGFWVASYADYYYYSQTWFQIKVLLVAILVVYHFWCAKIWKEFRADNNKRSHVFYRWFNEIPVLFLIAIVCLVVVKPAL